jgi:hypothetical protein
MRLSATHQKPSKTYPLQSSNIRFFVVMIAMRFLDMDHIYAENEGIPWQPFVFLGSLFIVFFVYRTISHYMSRLLFPPSKSEAQS